MERKVSIKTIYLLLVISLGLVGLGIGSTYAVFTASSEIISPITLNSNLSYDSNVIDTIDVTIPSGETVNTTLNITNNSGSTLNYVTWYTDEEYDIDVGVSSGTPSGSLTSGSSTSVVVDIRNNDDENVTLSIGILSSTNSVVLGEDMKLVPNEELLVNLITHIRNEYTSNSPELITHSKDDGTSDTYYYSYQDTDKTWGLMNDGFTIDTTQDATTTGLAKVVTDTSKLTSGTEGNIRYFGPSDSVNNYIYFNCNDYSNQGLTDASGNKNCELWRIIGIVDGKVKIIKNDSIGDLAWDMDKNQDSSLTTASNNWQTSSLQLFLNGLYYNRGTTESHTYYSGIDVTTETTLDLKTIGITEATRNNNLISESIWYLGGYNSSEVYPNDIYTYERINSTGTPKTIYSGNPYTINANIGLMYESDYGYSTNLKECSYNITWYNESVCYENSWLFNGAYQWLLTPYSDWAGGVWGVRSDGFVYDYAGDSNYIGVSPVLYLNSELAIESVGEGTSTEPYRISVS